jgi:predicted RNase H-like HicB family nuclease
MNSELKLIVEFDREEDGRWIASVAQLRGVRAYGDTRDHALARVQALALAVLADEIEHGERDPRTLMKLTFEPRAAA